MKSTILITTVMPALILLGCANSNSKASGGSGGGPGDARFEINGNWQVTTTSQSGVTGGAGGVFQSSLQNDSFSGSLSNIQPPCAITAALNGSLISDDVTFSLNENGQMLNFTGGISATGQLDGTYTTSSGGCTDGSSGTWNAIRIPAVTGNWNGTMTPASGGQLPFQLAGSLSQDDNGNVNGTAKLTGSECFTTVTLTTPNPIAGQQLVILGEGGIGAAVRFASQLNTSATSMTVSYTMLGGPCNEQTGSGTLKKQ